MFSGTLNPAQSINQSENFPLNGYFCPETAIFGLLCQVSMSQVYWSGVIRFSTSLSLPSITGRANGIFILNRVFSWWFTALLWTAPELLEAQRSSVMGMSTGTQKGDVYSFAIILHEILYRAGLFRCEEDDVPIPPKSEFVISLLRFARC